MRSGQRREFGHDDGYVYSMGGGCVLQKRISETVADIFFVSWISRLGDLEPRQQLPAIKDRNLGRQRGYPAAKKAACGIPHCLERQCDVTDR